MRIHNFFPGVGLSVGLWLLASVATAQGPEPLFGDGPVLVGAPRVQARGAGPRVLRSRTVRLRQAPLTRAVADGLAGTTAPLLTLNLFDDAAFPVVFERYQTDVLGHQTWVGRIDGDDQSTVTLTWRGATVVGGIQTRDAIYRLQGAMDAAVVEQVDPASFGRELAPLVPPTREGPRAKIAGEPAQAHDGELVGVLVYYTTAAKNAQGGQAAIEALIATGIADTNTAYTRSGVSATVQLAAAVELTGFTESASMSADLTLFRTNASVGAGRNTVGADLVTLIVQSPDPACGIGYIGPNQHFAHSITDRRCIVGNYTFAHELGHNFGSHHAPEDGATGAWKPYGYGYKDTVANFRTVMAYSPGTRILNFSNPNVSHNGRVTGSATQNNALSLREAFPEVQFFRTSTGAVPPTAPRNVTAVASGNTATVTWTAPTSGTPSTYLAQVGTSPGGSNIFSGAVGLVTSASSPLPNGTYYIRLYAQNGLGTSPASTEVTLTVGEVVALPGAPQNLTGSASGTSVSVAWSAPASGGAVTTYVAHVGTSSGTANVFAGPVGLVTAASGTIPPGTYFIRVYGQNAAGIGAASNELVVTVGASCSVPSAPSLTATVSGNTISASWTTPSGGPVSGYTVQAGNASGSSGLFNAPVGLMNAVSGAVPSGTYFIRVVANAACGSSGSSNEVSVTVP